MTTQSLKYIEVFNVLILHINNYKANTFVSSMMQSIARNLHFAVLEVRVTHRLIV